MGLCLQICLHPKGKRELQMYINLEIGLTYLLALLCIHGHIGWFQTFLKTNIFMLSLGSLLF